MTREERVAAAERAAQRSRTAAAQAELRHSMAVARLEAAREKEAQRREQLLGGLLIEAAGQAPECARVLARLVLQARAGKQAKLVDGWTAPACAENAPAALQPLSAVRPAARTPELPLPGAAQ